ncbi:hypothetical protein X772_26605 [Mesorhizobium sp. LSJC280B00]|nr:hypothetical protein X772_26605 [Mesorhizobium sp. LSJC280B00]
MQTRTARSQQGPRLVHFISSSPAFSALFTLRMIPGRSVLTGTGGLNQWRAMRSLFVGPIKFLQQILLLSPVPVLQAE